MKRFLFAQIKAFAFLSAFLLCGSMAKSQIKPFYFYNDKPVSDKEMANNYAITGKLSDENIWMFKRYDLDNNLIETGSYKDEALKTPDGVFIYYMMVDDFNAIYGTDFRGEINRFKATETTYVDGKLDGLKKTYYPTGKLMLVENYKNNQLDGLYESFDVKGQIYAQGNYKEGKKDGKWLVNYGKRKYFYENDKIVKQKE